ncbi:MAG: oligoribonuclease [Deltaproteobacteria bacterium]|nr:oligoribonuclease [Deltaproteobacteria bacterium]
MDLEMTGLNPDDCGIVQLAMIITDTDLNEVAPPVELTVWQPESVLERMSPFVRAMHEKSGLLPKIRVSQIAVDDAERKALELLNKHVAYRAGRLCGNSVWQDRRFLMRYMPTFESYLHYRQIDVSTLKELSKNWYSKSFPKPESGEHTALFDIQQSIAELKWLRKEVMR